MGCGGHEAQPSPCLHADLADGGRAREGVRVEDSSRQDPLHPLLETLGMFLFLEGPQFSHLKNASFKSFLFPVLDSMNPHKTAQECLRMTQNCWGKG